MEVGESLPGCRCRRNLIGKPSDSLIKEKKPGRGRVTQNGKERKGKEVKLLNVSDLLRNLFDSNMQPIGTWAVPASSLATPSHH